MKGEPGRVGVGSTKDGAGLACGRRNSEGFTELLATAE
jgi:hypothetical protein